MAMAEAPPVAPVKAITEAIHGTTVTDHYRYMEDFKNPEVQAWVKGQAEFAEKTLHALRGRDALLARITELDAGAPYSLFGVARQPGGTLFYFKQLAAENVAKVYRRDGKTGEERLLIDPETFPKRSAGEHFTVSFFRVSPDGAQLLYGFAASGDEQTTLKVYDLGSGKDLPDTIDRLESDYAPPFWLPDGKAFVYSRRRKLAADAPPAEGYKFTQAFLHTLGSDVERDPLVFAQGAPGSPTMGEMDFPAVIVPVGSAWAIGQVKHGDETDLSLYVAPIKSLGSAELKWVKVCDRADLVTEYAVHFDDIYLITAQDAPRFKVVRTPLDQPNFRSAAVVVPAGEYVVDSLAVAQDALYVGVLQGVVSKILRVEYAEGAKPMPVELPADEPSGGTAAARADLPGVFIGTRSWTRAGRLYQYDPQTQALTDTRLLPVGKFDTPDWLTATEAMVPSHDGVQVPLSIIHRKDVKLDGSNPTLLSGYGAYGFTEGMRFSPTSLAWLERGGVLAVAHVRGGGAMGKPWHHAGRKLTKPNTWKDFIACAEHLVSAGLHLAARSSTGKGGSAGGILDRPRHHGAPRSVRRGQHLGRLHRYAPL